MGSVEVTPIHLVHADSKHLLILGADPLSDDPVVDELVDVECGNWDETDIVKMYLGVDWSE